MREFLRNSKKFFEDVAVLKTYTKKFNRLSSQKNNGIHDSKTEKLLNNQLEIINQRFRELSNGLKNKLNEENIFLKENETSLKEFNKKTIVVHLHAQTKALAETVNEYRDAQFRYKQEEEEKFRLQYIIAKPDANEREVNNFISEDQGDVQIASAFTLGSKSAKGILEEAQKRKSNIQKIAVMIQELIEMMNILNEAISKQKKDVDKITVTIETARENTATANVDLEQALQYQIRASRIKRIIFGVLVIIVIASVGFFVLKVGISLNNLFDLHPFFDFSGFK